MGTERIVFYIKERNEKFMFVSENFFNFIKNALSGYKYSDPPSFDEIKVFQYLILLLFSKDRIH